jgi:hypothetical protein
VPDVGRGAEDEPDLAVVFASRKDLGYKDVRHGSEGFLRCGADEVEVELDSRRAFAENGEL